jgi:hypothetical protein
MAKNNVAVNRKTPTMEELQAQIDALNAENAALKTNKPAETSLSVKVSANGGLSIYGLNARFPVNLYLSQFRRLVAVMPKLEEFADWAEEKGILARKGDAKVEVKEGMKATPKTDAFNLETGDIAKWAKTAKVKEVTIVKA